MAHSVLEGDVRLHRGRLAARFAAPGRARRRASGAGMGRNVAIWLLAPTHALLLAVVVAPAIYVVWLSLTSSSFRRSPVYVGLVNYVQVLADPYFRGALLNTVVLVLVVVHVELLARLGMALLFTSGLPGRRFLLAAVLAPYAVSDVSAAVMWRFLFDPGMGPITLALHLLGLPGWIGRFLRWRGWR